MSYITTQRQETPSRFKKLAQVLNMAPMDLSLILVPMPERSDSVPAANHPGEATK